MKCAFENKPIGLSGVVCELADEVHPGEPKRRTSEDAFAPVPMLAEIWEAVLRSSLQLLEFAQNPLPKS